MTMVFLFMAVMTATKPRLYRARLRLAEAQGRIPPGLADEAALNVSAIDPNINSTALDVDTFLPPPELVSRIKEYNFIKVAEPELAYDPEAAETKLLAIR